MGNGVAWVVGGCIKLQVRLEELEHRGHDNRGDLDEQHEGGGHVTVDRLDVLRPWLDDLVRASAATSWGWDRCPGQGRGWGWCWYSSSGLRLATGLGLVSFPRLKLGVGVGVKAQGSGSGFGLELGARGAKLEVITS